MMRKSIVALATLAILGTAAIPMTSVAQRSDFSGPGMGNRAAFSNRSAFNNRGFNNRGFNNRGFNNRGFNNRFVARNNFARRGHFGPRSRFAFRHHFFRPGFAFASCSVVRRSWTPWGWRWRRIWVC